MSSESSPMGWYLVPIHSNCIIILFCCVKNVHNREIWGICKGCVGGWYACRIVPEVWGFVPVGHVNSPPFPHQTQVLEVYRAHN